MNKTPNTIFLFKNSRTVPTKVSNIKFNCWVQINTQLIKIIIVEVEFKPAVGDKPVAETLSELRTVVAAAVFKILLLFILVLEVAAPIILYLEFEFPANCCTHSKLELE